MGLRVAAIALFILVARGLLASTCPPVTPGTFLISFHDPSFTCSQSGGKCPEGQPIEFAVQAAGYDFSCGLHSFIWNFGDAQTASGQVVTHVYAAPGNYTVILSICNGTFCYTIVQAVAVSCKPLIGEPQPTQGPWEGGTKVTLSGSGFFGCCYTSVCPCPHVSFGTEQATIVSCTDTQVVVIAPPHSPGPVPISVLTTGAQGAVLTPGPFLYIIDSKIPTLSPFSLLILVAALVVIASYRLR